MKRTEAFTSDAAQILNILSFIAECAEQSPLSERQRLSLQLAAEEMAVNISSYSYQDGIGKIEVSVCIENGEFIVMFTDEGIEFNPFDAKKPDLSIPISERPVGGLGLMLSASVMDRIEYRRCGGKNINTLCLSIAKI